MWDHIVNGALKCAGEPRIVVGRDEIAMDPHIHSLFSHCSISQPEAIILRAVKLGISAICVMDHNNIEGSRNTVECSYDLKRRGLIPDDFLVIPGVEVSSDHGHIGALFVDETLPMSQSIKQTVDIIHDCGGLAVAVHPYHSTGVGERVFDAPFDAVEIECGAVFKEGLIRCNHTLAHSPKLKSVTKFGSSDTHYVNGVGTCYTVMKLPEPTLEAVREAIINGECSAYSSKPFARLRKLLGGIGKLD
ncbi:PHP domain-containing protein [bacterium]|nr:PHP domain-containing protein [bacterium]